MGEFVLFRGNRWNNDTPFIQRKLFDQWEGFVRVDFSLLNGEKGAPELEINNDEKLTGDLLCS